MDKKQDRLLTLKEVANILNVHYSTVWRLVSLGEIKSIKVLSSRRVRESAIQEYIDKQERTQE